MELSKLELQQMLREMNVKFDATASYESLKERLKQENRSSWLKSVSERVSADGKTEKSVIRKRKRKVPGDETGEKKPTDSSSTSLHPLNSPNCREDRTSSEKTRPFRKQAFIEKPTPGKPWKEVADGTEPFNRKKKVFETVLRRSGNRCELCGAKPGESKACEKLQPYHILPLDQGGEHSIKNVAALCDDCLKTIVNDPDPKTLKKLKRRTRLKLYDAIKVEKKSTRRSRRRTPRRRR